MKTSNAFPLDVDDTYAQVRFPSYVRGEIEDVVQSIFDPECWWVLTSEGRYLVKVSEVERVEG